MMARANRSGSSERVKRQRPKDCHLTLCSGTRSHWQIGWCRCREKCQPPLGPSL